MRTEEGILKDLEHIAVLNTVACVCGMGAC